MACVSISSDNLTECGRVYCFSNQEKRNFFTINCILCNGDYSEWLKFTDHIKNIHQLENIEHNKTHENEKLGFGDSQIKTKVKPETHQLEDYLNVEYLDDEFSSYDEEVSNINKQVENNSGSTDQINPSDNNAGNESFATISSCFFRLYSTETNIMLKFIELLRQHPSQWENNYSIYEIKEKRQISTLNLTKQLNKILNININPQGTRASILTLLRWFDREYIRYLNCQQNDFQFVSMYKKYFDKLLEFLPLKHLKPMTCDKCPKHFKTEHLLLAHRHKYHNGQVPFRCRYCGHGFIHQSSHKVHENRHIKIYIWPCRVCRYQATTKSDYIKHLLTHSSQQLHHCNICGLSYKTKYNLNVHFKSHSLPKYECEFCKKKFYEKYRYKRHIWQHEEQEKTCKSIDNFICEICARRFTSNKTLKIHQLSHVQDNNKKNKVYKLTDVIAYLCNHCSLEFIYKEAFETHMHLKHGDTGMFI